MDMKRILQAMDGVATQPVAGANDMKKFLQVVSEGANPHKVTLPVQMAMQHYSSEAPVAESKPAPKKPNLTTQLFKYYEEVEQEFAEEETARKELISEQARAIAGRVSLRNQLDELSKDTLKKYVKANKEDTVQRASSDSFKSGKAGDAYNKADETHKDKMREKGMDRAMSKLEGLDPNEYDHEGQMARQDLSTAEEAAEELRSILHNMDNLPEWVQAKITKAVDYLDTARDYMKSVDESRYGSRDAHQRDYDSSQTGFGRRGREDDEYHVPDPVDNRIAYKVIATVTTPEGAEEKKSVSVKTTSGPKHAEAVATKHLEGAGLQVTGIVSVHDLGPV